MPTTTSKNLGQVAAIISGSTAPANTSVIWLDISGVNSIKKIYDPIALQWIPLTQAATVAGDNWGTQVTVTDTSLSGDGTTDNPLAVAPQGATTGQILRFNGTTWVPDNEVTGGLTSVSHDTTLSGDGSVGQPLSIAQQSAATDQVLTWNGTTWIPKAPQLGAVFYPGMIMMWAGIITNIPPGWGLCDGSLGTANLSGMFVVGYNVNDGDYNLIGKSGGAKTVALTGTQNGQHSHGVNDPGHTHNFVGLNKGAGDGGNVIGYENGSLSKATSSSSTNISIQTSGTGAPHENRPPYYTLAYIQKL